MQTEITIDSTVKNDSNFQHFGKDVENFSSIALCLKRKKTIFLTLLNVTFKSGRKAGGGAKNSIKKPNFSAPLLIFCLDMGFEDFVFNIFQLMRIEKCYFKCFNFIIRRILIKI